MLNRQCQIHNDPHVRTFDGRVYDYMDVGEYVMYRNDKGPYAVSLVLIIVWLCYLLLAR